MSSEPQARPAPLRNVKSPFSKIIATHYDDGPVEGFLEHREWADACVFRLLDWDPQTDLRTYEICKLPETSFEAVVGELFQNKLPTWPIWVLPSAARLRGEQLVDSCFARTPRLATLVTTDLFDEIAIWEPASDAPVSSGAVVLPGKGRADVG